MCCGCRFDLTDSPGLDHGRVYDTRPGEQGPIDAASPDAEIVRHGWSRRFGGPEADYGRAVVVDQSGNIYLAGFFYGTVDLGGGPLPTPSGGRDVFLASYTPAGKHRWSTHWKAGPDLSRAEVLAVDEKGSVFLAGGCSGTVDFGGGPMPEVGYHDIYIASFTSGSGKHRWSKRFGTTSHNFATAMAVNGSGEVVLAGHFNGAVDLGGGPLTSAGSQDVFLASFTNEGKHRWSRRFGAAEGDRVTGLAVDGSNNILLGGTFKQTASLGGAQLASAGGSDCFYAKYSPAGDHLWSARFGGQLDEVGPDLVVGSAGVFLAGHFEGTVDFGGGGVKSAGGHDIYLSRYTPSGKHQVSRRFGGTSADQVTAAALDPRGGVVVTGTFFGTSDLGGGGLAATGEEDLYVARYDDDGRHLWSRAFGGPKLDESWAVAVDDDGTIVVAGAFEGEIDLGGGPLSSAGKRDGFLLRLER
jgi:hypothetical protein